MSFPFAFTKIPATSLIGPVGRALRGAISDIATSSARAPGIRIVEWMMCCGTDVRSTDSFTVSAARAAVAQIRARTRKGTLPFFASKRIRGALKEKGMSLFSFGVHIRPTM